ncbi:competence/damage-inducible protein A [Clostridium sp. HBUAS56010]|uniref:competence/damage-inducible protein A n=1 Tax=Clostridium sp. HBUAS56010 TaxID=2571127 RepID=UPI00117793F3|nr:competence/damage-inducible protein A [Clostridium sp. HBUAS56010]
MVVELISVGTELLLGNIVNTNTQFLAEKCALLGLTMYHQVTVGDNRERLRQVLETALERSDVVILTGGLGPTEDDLTKEVCAEVMGSDLVEDSHTKEQITNYFKNSIYKEIPDNNWKQAMVPQGAIVLDNNNGTAPGLIIEKDGKTAVLLPGPPNELKPLFMEQVFPFLQKRQPEVIHSRMIKICGPGESQVENRILDLIDGQSNPTIATYAKTAEVHLRVTAKASSEKEAKELLKPMVKEIKSRFGNDVYSTKEDETLEMTVVRLLKKHELTVTTAESCTGGLIAGRIVNVSGASEVFQEGFVTYANKAKRKYLNVNKSTLKKYGAVSSQTAKEMATGGVFATDADVCIAVTGIAGPNAEGEKPVGLVYMACYLKDKVKIEEYHFKGNREKIREQSVVKALDLLRRCILSNYNT